MKFQRFIFSVVLLVFCICLTLTTVEVYAYALHFSASFTRLLTYGALGVSLLFMTSFFFNMIGVNGFKKNIVYSINLIAGVVFYLFISAVVACTFVVISTISSIIFSQIIFLILFFGFILLSIIGALQATYIKYTHYTVTLPNAPSSWKNRKAVLVSDTHFGSMNHKKFSDKVVQAILKENPNFVLHAGDFYDGPKNNMSIITDSWKNLTSKVPVFYTPGNHEMYGDYEGFIRSIRDAQITILRDEVTDYDGVQIAGITYRAKNQEQEAQTALSSLSIDMEKPLILINHPPTFHSSAKGVDTNLMVSGHTHRGQFWPNNFITRLIYKKYHYGMTCDDAFTTITTSGVGTAVIPMRLFNTPEIVVITFIN